MRKLGNAHECPSCKGSGKLKICSSMGLNEPVITTEINCISCEGQGRISQEQFEYLKWEAEQWCQCDDNDDDVYYDDGEHPDCFKHHWRHRECGKIIQIG